MRYLWIVIVSAFTATFVGCSSSEEMAIAEQAVERFHQQLNGRQFEAIYDEAAEEFQKSDSKEQIVSFLRAVNTKLGNVRSAKRASWNVNVSFSQTNVALGYETDFQEGVAQEQFTFRVKDSQAKLIKYTVQSKALVLK